MEVPQFVEALADMPLHDITEQYGEVGLKARFDLETWRFSPEDQLRVMDAANLALAVHADQYRKDGTPYANHLLRVAIRVMSPKHYDSDNPELVIAAILHDSVEDQAAKLAGIRETSGTDEKEAALLNIEWLYGPVAARTVAAVTNPSFDEGGDWFEQYRKHLKEMLLLVPESRVIKVSDFTDNGIGVLLYSPEDTWVYFSKKYAPLIEFFREVIQLPDTPLSEAAKRLILAQLDQAEERFARIIG